MAISDSQKVDYLWKKLGYSASKTDTNANKKAPNEAISSPLQMRGDKVMKESSSIPSTQPSSSTGVVTTYPTSGPIECTEDITSTASRTWKTGQTDWISPEFGSTYQVKVYIHTSSDSAGASGGTQVFATGSGNDDEWFFDYQSGVLHFIGSNLPNGVSFTGKSVYIAGSRYSGDFGVGGDTGDFTFTNNEMAVGAGDPIVMDNTTGLVVPVGTTAQRNGTPVEGELRWNTTTGNVEVYDGSSWDSVGGTQVISADEFDGDDTTTGFSMSQVGTTDATLVAINGVVQEAGTDYTVSGTTLTFTTAPATGDRVQVRNFSSGASVNFDTAIIQDTDNDTKIQVEESSDEDTIRFDIAGTEQMVLNSSGLTVGAYTLPLTDGSANYVLETDGSGTLSWVAQSGGDVVDDTTPQLGGDLDLNSSNITSDGDAIIVIDANDDATNNYFQITYNGTSSRALKVLDGGNINFYADNGSSEKFEWDATNYYVAIGHNAPAAPLHIRHNDTDQLVLHVSDGSNAPTITFKNTDGNKAKLVSNDNSQFHIQLGSSNTEVVEFATTGIRFHDAFTFPTSDGSANQFLQTDGSGALSFASATVSDISDLTATATELNYVDGVTSNVQTQLDAKYGSGDDATFDTITVDDGIKEKLQTKSITSTGTFTFQCASGQIFYVSSPAGNWTANFTDLTIASNYATTTTIVIAQGSTAYIPTGIAIAGSSATINWQGGSAPTGTNNGIDVVTFSFLNVGGTYTVLGQLTDF